MSHVTKMNQKVTSVILSELIDEVKPGFAIGKRSDNGVIQVRMNNVDTEGKLDLEDVIRVPATLKQVSNCSLSEGDVLFNNTNSTELVGKSAVFRGHSEPVTFSNHFTRLRVDLQRLDPYYLARWLTWQQQHRVFEGLCTRWVGQSAVRSEKLLALKIPLPPLSEQKRIAAILDKTDSIRRKRQEVQKLAQQLPKTTFYHTFGRDFLERGDNVPLESLVDPERGISYGVVQRGSNDPSGIPVARISNIARNVFDDSDFVRVAPDISDKYRRTVLNGGEILVSIRGTVGRTAIAPLRAEGWNVSREVAVIPLQPHVSRRFIHQLILTDEAQRFITGNVRGVAQQGINLKDLRQLPVPSPESGAVEQFKTRIERLEQFEQEMACAFTESNNLFQSLVQRAFKGEL